MAFTYFLISPGNELDSYVQYKAEDEQGNYIKFGDSTSSHEDSDGIRKAYLTHNPDIGVAAVMDSSVFTNPRLGTLLKNYIVTTLEIPPVGTSEWFSVDREAAWKLFYAMQKWDRRTLSNSDLQQLQLLLNKILGG